MIVHGKGLEKCALLAWKKRTDVGLGVLYNPSLGSVLIRAVCKDLSVAACLHTTESSNRSHPLDSRGWCGRRRRGGRSLQKSQNRREEIPKKIRPPAGSGAVQDVSLKYR